MTELKTHLQIDIDSITTKKPKAYPKRIHLPLALFAAVFLTASASIFFPQYENKIERILTDPIETVTLTGMTSNEQFDLREFYFARDYKSIWLEKDSPKVEALFLLKILKSSHKLGLNQNSYFADKIEYRIMKTNAQDMAELEILLTVASAKLATHLHKGRFHYITNELNPINFDIFVNNDDIHDIFSDFFHYEPKNEQYSALKNELARLRKLQKQGGWPVLPDDTVLKPKMNDVRITHLKQRLKLTGDLPLEAPETAFFDKQLNKAIKQFQKRNGIRVSGHADRKTLKALNIPIEKRINQLMVNMDRWRSIASELGEDYIMVNTASYRLHGMRNGKEKINMRVVVGQKDWETPAISSQIREVVLNPDWRVPQSIAVGEILPKLQKQGYSKKKMPYVFTRMIKGKMRVIDPKKVDWKEYSAEYFPFQLTQQPGRRNPLGKVKFFMPNDQNIYLHDTPYRSAFKTDERSRSHGCIRLERPLKLASFVLNADSQWTLSKMRKVTRQSNQITRIKLKEPLDVHLAYFTNWVDENGLTAYYDDVYQRDPGVVATLNL